MSQALPRIYLAIGMKGMEDFLKQRLKNEYLFVGEAIYREQVVKNAIPAKPDIIILRETLNGSKNILDIVYELRLQLPDTRIIFLASDRKPGDPLLAELVSNGVYDFLTGNQISAPDLIHLIREPNKFSDVAMYRPKVRVNEDSNEVLYDAPVKEVIKPVKKTVYVEGASILPSNYGKNKPEPNEEEKEEPRVRRRNRRRFLTKLEKAAKKQEELGEELKEAPSRAGDPLQKEGTPDLIGLSDEPKVEPERRKPEPLLDIELSSGTRCEAKRKERPTPSIDVRPDRTEEAARHESDREERVPLFGFEPETNAQPASMPQPEPEFRRQADVRPLHTLMPVPSSSNVPQEGVSGKQKILTFVGGEYGVGNTQVAFTTALTLGKRGFRTIFIELREQGATIEYLYQLALLGKGLDVALEHLLNENFLGLENSIIRMADVRTQNINQIMADNYRKFPDTVDFLFFSPDYVLEEDENKKKINPSLIKELCMHLIFQSGYHYIILDAEPDLFNPFTEVALGFGTHVFFTITQDVCHIGRAVRNISEIEKRINVTGKLYYILNKYDDKATLTQKDIEGWLKQEVETVIPLLHKDFIDANMKGIPVLFHTKDQGFQKAFHEIVDHILKK